MGWVKDTFLKLVNSKLYIALSGFMCFVGWHFRIEAVMISILALLTGLILIFSDDITPSITFFFTALFIIRDPLSFSYVPIWIIIVIAFLFVAILIYFIKNKVKLRLSMFGISAFILVIVSIFSMINIDYDVITPEKSLLALSGIVYFVIYLFFANGKTSKSTLDYLAFTAMIFGLVIACEIFVSSSIFTCADCGLKKIICGCVDLGWGIENDACIYINISIAFAGYLLIKMKHFYIPAIIGVFDILAVLVSGSRGGILALCLMLIGILVIGLIKSKNKVRIILVYIGMALICFFSALILLNPLSEFFDCIFQDGLSLTGRENLYRLAIDSFKNHPIFGGSIFAGIDSNNRLIVYHSFIFQTIGCFGIIGVIAFIWAMIVQYRVILKSKNDFKWFFFVLVTVSMIHGLIDNVYYMVCYMIIIYICFAIYEKEYAEVVELIDISNSSSENTIVEPKE